MATIGSLLAYIGIDTKGLDKGLAHSEKAMKTSTKKMGDSLRTLKRVAVAAFAGWSVKKLGEDFLDTAVQFEQFEVKLNALTNGRGVETLKEINEWALDMPVNTAEAVDAFVKMQAMGLDPTIDKMQILVDTASIFGDDVLPRVSRALGQMQTLGKLSAEELNQLSESGINARKYLTEAFGQTVEEIQKSGIAIEEVIGAIWTGLERDFGGSAKKQMNSWVGLMATFKSYITEIQRSVMDAGLFTELKKQMEDVNTQIKLWFENNKDLIKVKVPEYIDKIKTGLQNIWNIISYDPAILEWGIVGLAFGGKKGAVIMGALGHMASWAENLSKALGLAAGGVVSFSEIATANFEELEEIVNRFEASWEDQSGMFFKIPKEEQITRPGQYIKITKPGEEDPLAGYDPEAAAGLHQMLNEKQALVDEFNETYKQSQMSTWEWEQEQLIERANAYTQAGADKIAVQEWVGNELQKLYDAEDEENRRREEQKQKIQAQSAKLMVDNWKFAFQTFGKDSKIAFKAFQAVSIAEALVNTYNGATGAYKVGASIGGPWLGAAYAAAAIAAGMAQVSAIASLSPGATSSASSSSSGAITTTTDTSTDISAPVFWDDDYESQRALTIIFEGDVRIEDEAYIEELAEKINEAVEDREVTLIASRAKFAEGLA